ncbi:MAG: hypothetical protein NDI61_00490 [Bdellovibrionaceae bacterium]|nr:hypothetical protein [Pseudobdellovibrionaceae bacterium]
MRSYSSRLAFFVSVFAVLAGVACTVEPLQAPNQPPTIPTRAMKLERELGTIKPESFTIFLWPESFTNDPDSAVMISKVLQATSDLDQLQVELDALTLEESEKLDEFESLECLTYAELEEGEDPDLVEWVEKWKELEAGNEKMARDLDICITNQERRRHIQQLVFENANVQQASKVKEVFTTIDPGYPNSPDSTIKTISPRQSRFELKLNGSRVDVKVLLKDFTAKGNHQSTEEVQTTVLGARIFDATYDLTSKVMRFKVPEVKDGSLTGAVYHFELERATLARYARFQGDVKRIGVDGTGRLGSASFYGMLE